MIRSVSQLIHDEVGMVLSAELVILATVVVLGLIVGLAQVQDAIVTELQDTAMAFTGLNQSYGVSGYAGCWKFGRRLSWTSGSFFVDVFDSCVGTAAMGGGAGEIMAGPQMAPAGIPTVVTPLPGPAPTPCVECVPSAPAVTEPCHTCPPLPSGPQPAVPQGPVPQNLPQQ